MGGVGRALRIALWALRKRRDAHGASAANSRQPYVRLHRTALAFQLACPSAISCIGPRQIHRFDHEPGICQKRELSLPDPSRRAKYSAVGNDPEHRADGSQAGGCLAPAGPSQDGFRYTPGIRRDDRVALSRTARVALGANHGASAAPIRADRDISCTATRADLSPRDRRGFKKCRRIVFERKCSLFRTATASLDAGSARDARHQCGSIGRSGDPADRPARGCTPRTDGANLRAILWG